MTVPVYAGIEKYIKMRRRFGFDYQRGAQNLRHLAKYLKKINARSLKTTMVLDWLATFEGSSNTAQSIRLGHARDFASYWKTFDSRTEIPDRRLSYHHKRRPVPKIFSANECQTILRQCRHLREPAGVGVDLTPSTYRTLFGLVMAAGLRRSEVIKLKREHVDFENGRILIEMTKFRKSRLIPLHKSVVARLRGYAARRNRLIPNPKSESFFLMDKGRGVSNDSVYSCVIGIIS